MVDDVLRMRALIVADQALAEVRKLERGLRDVGQRGGVGFRQANTEAMKFAQTVKTIGTETAGTLVPGLMSIGSAAGPIGLVVAGLVAAGLAVKKMATALVEMKVQAGGIGISISQLRALQNVAEQSGRSVGVFTSNLQSFADEASQLKYRVGGLYETLNRLGKFELRDKLVGEKDPAKQFAIMLDDVNAVAREKGVGVGRTYAKMLQIDPSLVGLSPEQLREAQKNAGDVYDRALPAAQALHEEWVKTSEEIAKGAASLAAMTVEMGRQQSALPAFGRRAVPRPREPTQSPPQPQQTPPSNLNPISPDELGADGVVPPGYVLTPRQHGGPAHRGRPYLVGERGPEVMIPHSSGNIIPSNWGGAGYRNLGGTGVSGGSNADEASRVVQKGVFDALVQFKSYVEAGQQAGGGGGGIMGASFGGSAGAAGGGGVGGSGGVGGGGGRGPTFRRGVGPGAEGGGEPDTSDPSKGGSDFLKSQRARFAKEMEDNPELKKRAAAIIQLENPGAGTAVIESAMNRAAMSGRTLASVLGGGPKSFYGPARRGLVEPTMRNMSPKTLAERIRQIDRAVAGSNQTLGATDQGSAGDPNYERGGTGVNINRERFNDWGGFRGVQHSREWRLAQQAQVRKTAAEAAKKSDDAKTTAGTGAEVPAKTTTGTGARMPAKGGRYSDRVFGPGGYDPESGGNKGGSDREGNAPLVRVPIYKSDKQSMVTPTDRIDGAIGGGMQPTGSVAVTINSNGTKASAAAKSGGFFQETKVTQHRQMKPTESAPEQGFA